jgi:glycosyltransferase involved in cell wall biosynthesis
VTDAGCVEGLPAGLKVALVHDWLTGMRGGEKCLEVMAEMFPAADLFTLLHIPGRVSPVLENRTIQTSFVQNLPSAEKIYRWALPFFPRAIEAFDLSQYDLVFSSSHCVAKSAVPATGALSVCYCHTPMRYVWDRFDDYFGSKPFPVRQMISAQAARLRSWDRETADRVHFWLANSTVVRQRILDWYGVSKDKVSVVHPPVDIGRFGTADNLPVPDGLVSGGYDLVVSALVAYKRIDLAVLGALKAGVTLVVVGKGPELERLKKLVDGHRGEGRVYFAGAVSDADLPGYYAHCRSFVFPGLEDFGITPLEATASGRPVVAFGEGGVLDTVVEGLNGLLFREQTVDAVAAALASAQLNAPWNSEEMIQHAMGFSRERYRREMDHEIRQAWRRHQGHPAGENVGD